MNTANFVLKRLLQGLGLNNYFDMSVKTETNFVLKRPLAFERRAKNEDWSLKSLKVLSLKCFHTGLSA